MIYNVFKLTLSINKEESDSESDATAASVHFLPEWELEPTQYIDAAGPLSPHISPYFNIIHYILSFCIIFRNNLSSFEK